MEQPEIVELIQRRKSVRTYDERALSVEDSAYLDAVMAAARNPFGETVKLHRFDVAAGRPSTFGVVRGAHTFIGATAEQSAMGALALGYQFENVVLGLEARGLHTVWLAGTFKRKDFASSMGIRGNAWLPVVSPVGYQAARPSTVEKMMRRVARSDERELWRDIFTEDGFQVQLSEDAAGAYALPLEMLRLAPSSSNGQPWRVVKKGRTFYFYETHKASLGQQQALIKVIDLGIGIAHFHLTTQALGLSGHFDDAPLEGVRIPEDTFYRLSWVAD